MGTQQRQDPMKRPNVLILMTDQQRWDTLAAAGFDWMHTPNLDRLAGRGALMTHAFCHAPVCMPSRQSFLTGRYPRNVGCTCNGVEMPEDIPCLQHMLKPYGYVTGNLGKLHFRNHANRDHRAMHPLYGFDELVLSDEPGCYDDAYIAWVAARDPSAVDACRCSTPPAWTGEPLELQPRNTHEPYAFQGPEHLTHSAFVADETIRFVETHRHRPWLAIAGFYAPHAPVNPPQRWLDFYADVDIPRPQMTEADRDRLGLSDERWLEVRRAYAALVSHVDQQIGRILDRLDELGLTDDTLVIFTSDHGEHLGDHGQVQKGPPGLESCARVPLIVAGPGHMQPARHDELIELVDVLPTILDACGVQTPPEVQGRSFWPLVSGAGDYAPRSSAYCEFRREGGLATRTIRTGRFRYAAAQDGRQWLFDLQRDPGELVNLADDPASRETRNELRDELLTRTFDTETQCINRTGPY